MKTMFNFKFQELPQEHRSLGRVYHDFLLEKIYSNFTFFYLNNKDQKEDSINKYLSINLKNVKFITFLYFNHFQNIDEKNDQTNNIASNIVICTEQKCLIIESIIIKSITNFFTNQKLSFLNVSIPFDKSNQNKNDYEAIEEVRAFTNKLFLKIKKSKFLEITFFPVLSFLIRRHFYPSYFFEDKSFFSFNESLKSNEKSFKDHLFNFINDEKSDFTTKFKQLKVQLINDIEKNKQKNDTSNQLIEFNSNDFISLRTVGNNYYSFFYLVIHIESLQIFLMKENKITIKTHENEFCNFLSKHPSEYFTPCYGFIKKNGVIVATIYQFMSNGSLDNFLKNKEVDDIFVFTTTCRILNGIFYLHNNSLVHRDLKPSNILIDHDGKAYISDFETIRLFQGSNEKVLNKEENYAENEFSIDICSLNYSPPEQVLNSAFNLSTGIYSYGEILYFLFEKKDLFDKSCNHTDIIERKKTNKIPMMKSTFKYIENIYKNCVMFDYEKRYTIDKIQLNLFSQFDSLDFLNSYFIEDENYLHSMIQYFNEIYNLILEFNIDYQLQSFINNNLFSFMFLNYFSSEHNRFDLVFILGLFFFHGKFVNKDYIKTMKCFELSAENKNINAFLALGDLYYNGVIVKKNRQKAGTYYSKLSNNFDSKNNPHYYFDYFYEFLNDIQI